MHDHDTAWRVLVCSQCLAFLGSRFRRLMRSPARLTDAEAGKRLIRHHVLVHLSPEDVRLTPIIHIHPIPRGPNPSPLTRDHVSHVAQADMTDCGDAKAELLLLMLRRLYALAAGREREDSPDSLVNQEVRNLLNYYAKLE